MRHRSKPGPVEPRFPGPIQRRSPVYAPLPMPAELAAQQEADPPYDANGYFDVVAIANTAGPKPAPGDGGVLLGAYVGPVAGAPILAFPRISRGARAHLYRFEPILYGAIGPVAGPVIPGAGVTIRWRILVNNAPRYPYQNWTTNTAAESPGGRPILELASNDQLQIDVLMIDPAGLYERAGVRIMGRIFAPKARRR